jgi:hypothetical protein
MERFGTICGIMGAFLVALKMPQWGYPFFLVSSLCLLVSAIRKKQGNFIVLQGVFFAANIIGFWNWN